VARNLFTSPDNNIELKAITALAFTLTLKQFHLDVLTRLFPRYCQVKDGAAVWYDWGMNPSHAHYAGHRFPAEIISHTVWLYFRFTLSFRDIEELMASRGVILTYESIRQWCLKFGQVFANEIRRRQPTRGDKWYDRQEGPQAWKVDFTAKRQAALGAAAPHWQKADTEKNAALALGKAILETESALATVDEKNKAKLQQQLRDLKAGQQAREQAAKLAQAEGDALYWPI